MTETDTWVVTSLGRFASKYGEDAGLAVELCWAGPLCVQRETVEDSEEEDEDGSRSRAVAHGVVRRWVADPSERRMRPNIEPS